MEGNVYCRIPTHQIYNYVLGLARLERCITIHEPGGTIGSLVEPIPMIIWNREVRSISLENHVRQDRF